MINRFEIRDDKVAMFLDNKDGIVLETIIDKDDFEKVNAINYKWHALKAKNSHLYYVRTNILRNGKRITIFLHRLLVNCPKGLEVDHINLNTLDNTRKNLRIATRAENNQNRSVSVANKSGFRGVNWSATCGKWEANISVGGKQTRLGFFDDIHKAAQVAHEARKKLMPYYVY
jgi:AP2 domain./HNH endonuclease.